MARTKPRLVALNSEFDEEPVNGAAPNLSAIDGGMIVEADAVAPAQAAADDEFLLEPEYADLLPRRHHGPARIIAVVSGKGGVGKSVVAANLAASLAKTHGLTTAVLDLSLQYGDQALMFDGGSSPSLVDVLANIDALTPDFLLECMHRPLDNLRVLGAPPAPELADLVEPVHVQAIMGHLRRLFDVVVVDNAAYLSDVALDVIDSADNLVVVTSPYLASIKDTKLLLKLLSDLQVSGRKISAVLNRIEGTIRISLEVLEANLKFPIAAELPYTPQLIESVTDGQPLALAKPQIEFAQKLSGLAATLAAKELAEIAVPHRRSFLRLRRG